MEQERAGVVAYFKAQHNLDYGQDYWNHEVAGTTPKAALQQKTVDRLVHEKAEQLLFQELGLVQDIRYATFLEQLEKTNRNREQAAKEGKVVYGPIRYTQLQFYGHWKATLRAQATEQLEPNVRRLWLLSHAIEAGFPTQPAGQGAVINPLARTGARERDTGDGTAIQTPLWRLAVYSTTDSCPLPTRIAAAYGRPSRG